MSYRADVVAAARSDIGSGPRSEYYGHWCGQAVLRWLHCAGLALDVEWQRGRGFVLGLLPETKAPRPGDVGIVRRNAAGQDVWHHVLLESLDAEFARCIAGNTGPAPGHVACQSYPLDRADLRWYSIDCLEATP